MTTCAELGNEWLRLGTALATGSDDALHEEDALHAELDEIEQLLIETKAESLPDAAAKIRFAALNLSSVLNDDELNFLHEVAHIFAAGKCWLVVAPALHRTLAYVEQAPDSEELPPQLKQDTLQALIASKLA